MLQPFQYTSPKIASSALSEPNIEITFLIMGANDSMVGQRLFDHGVYANDRQRHTTAKLELKSWIWVGQPGRTLSPSESYDVEFQIIPADKLGDFKTRFYKTNARPP